MTTKGLLKELGSIAIIISAIVIGVLLIGFFDNKTFTYSLIGYVSIFLVLLILNTFVKNKFFQKTTDIISLPLGLLMAIGSALIPFLTLFIHLAFYFGFAYGIPELIYKTLNYFHLIDQVTQPTIIYLKITVTVTLSVLFNPLLRDIIYQLSPMTRKSSEKLKKYELNKLTDYFLSTDNVRFFVYGFYVITLLIVNICCFQGQPVKISTDIDKLILQSFITFIAIDRVLILMKALNFRSTELLNQICQTIKIMFNEGKNK